MQERKWTKPVLIFSGIAGALGLIYLGLYEAAHPIGPKELLSDQNTSDNSLPEVSGPQENSCIGFTHITSNALSSYGECIILECNQTAEQGANALGDSPNIKTDIAGPIVIFSNRGQEQARVNPNDKIPDEIERAIKTDIEAGWVVCTENKLPKYTE